MTCNRKLTFLWEVDVLLQCGDLRLRMFFHFARDQITEEDIELLTTIPCDGSAQTPHNHKQKQTLQPHGYLLAGQILCTCGTRCSNFI